MFVNIFYLYQYVVHVYILSYLIIFIHLVK